jgi:hypothetical protein
MFDQKYYRIATLVLIPVLLVSLSLNLVNFLQPKYVTGIVDHKSVGTGTDGGEPVEWYTISLWLVTEDVVNGFGVGETIAYVVDEASYLEVAAGDVVKAALRGDLKIDVLEVTHRTSRIVWERSGGFMGLNEKIEINDDGAASYTSAQFGDGEIEISGEEYEQLVRMLNYFTGDAQFAAKTGVADYFVHRITVQSGLGTRVIDWVDGWASQEPLPAELEEINLRFLGLVERLRGGSAHNASERAAELAREFLVGAPTFSFDGIPETLNVTEIRIMESFPVQYVVVIDFDSRHAGYGDRTGQALAQVITGHIAEVKVVSDNVVSAILDGQWDEIAQRMLE